MTIQELPLTLRWRIDPNAGITIQVQRHDTVTPHPVAEMTLTAQQIVLLQAEHACRVQGLVWTEDTAP